MKTALGLLLMLLKVSLGVETYCDGRLNGTQCYGALGGTAIIQLLNNSSEIYGFSFSNRTGTILSLRQGKSLNNRIANRSVFTPTNGTFRIDMLSWSDDAQYTIEIFGSNGKREELRTLQLTIEAPVTSVRLMSECLSEGQKRVSCSSDGDSPQYSWTLDGDTLSDTDLLSGDNKSNEITLKQNVSGQLICSVRNHVSSVSEGEVISTCGFIFIDCNLSNGTHISKWVFEANNTLCNEPTTTATATSPTTVNEGKETDITVSIKPSTNITSSNQTSTSTDVPWYIQSRYLIIMAGILAALLILLIAGVTLVFVHKKKQSDKEEPSGQELMYADIRTEPRHGRQVQKRVDEVEYGEIKISGQPQQTAGRKGTGSAAPREETVEYGELKFSQQPQQPVERKEPDCVYSKVR